MASFKAFLFSFYFYKQLLRRDFEFCQKYGKPTIDCNPVTKKCRCSCGYVGYERIMIILNGIKRLSKSNINL
jgi:hypothetical protein